MEQESLNISKRNIRGILGLKIHKLGPNALWDWTRGISPHPFIFFFFVRCKDRICYHVPFHLDQRNYQKQKSGWCCDSRCAVIGCLVTENNLNRSTKCVTWGPGLSSFTFKNRKPIWASVYASGLPAMGPPSFSGLKGPKEALVPLLSPQWGWGWGSISLIAGGSVMCKDQGSHKQEWSSDVTDSLSLSILSYWKTKHSPGLKF